MSARIEINSISRSPTTMLCSSDIIPPIFAQEVPVLKSNINHRSWNRDSAGNVQSNTAIEKLDLSNSVLFSLVKWA